MRTLRLCLGYQGGPCPGWGFVILWWSLPADWPTVRPLHYPPTVRQAHYSKLFVHHSYAVPEFYKIQMLFTLNNTVKQAKCRENQKRPILIHYRIKLL